MSHQTKKEKILADKTIIHRQNTKIEVLESRIKSLEHMDESYLEELSAILGFKKRNRSTYDRYTDGGGDRRATWPEVFFSIGKLTLHAEMHNASIGYQDQISTLNSEIYKIKSCLEDKNIIPKNASNS